MTRALGAAVSLGALLATAACGSTVAMRSSTSIDPQNGLSQQAIASGAGTTGGGSALGRPGAVAGAGGAVSTSPTAAAAPSSLLGGTAGSVALPSSPKTPVVIGVITSGNVGGLGTSLGLNLQYGDQRAQAQLIANHLNDEGGILGHKIKLVYYDYDVSSSAQTNAQAACSAFTEDNHAIAAMGIAGMDDAFHQCAAQHGMYVLSDADEKSTSFFRRFPTTIEISDMDLVRKYHAMVLALKGMGFFTPGAKVGLVYSDEPNDIEGIRTGMKPALSSIGLTVTDEVALSSDESQYVSEMSSSILKFRAEGVTHVLFGTAAAWLFAQSAAKQGYYPMLGVESRQSPGLLMQTVDSQQSLVKVMGIGYQPVQDVDASHDPGPVSAQQKLCLKLLAEGGQGSSSRLALASALYLCDELFFMHSVFAGAPDLSRTSLLQGLVRLGSSYQSSLTFVTRYSATQHDGAQGYRPLKYFTSCSCFQYAGPVQLFS